MQYLHTDLGFRSAGDVVVVTLTEGANVRLLDSSNFAQYQNGQSHNFYGGLATQSPVRLPIPHSGVWHVAVDLQGLANSTRASVRVIPGEALRPLPPIPTTPPALPSAPPTLTDVVAAAALSYEGPREWDVFIAHATEDKDLVAAPLAQALKENGLNVWYDEFELRIGDSLRRCIDNGIAKSRFGVVVLSQHFLGKQWPQYELDGLVTRTNSDNQQAQTLLPIWHNISKDEVMSYSPSLADRVARSTTAMQIKDIAAEIASVVDGGAQMPATRGS